MSDSERAVVEVRACWDEEAALWSAAADNLPGLATEATTVEALMDKLCVMVPQMLAYQPDLRDRLGPDIHLVLERTFAAMP